MKKNVFITGAAGFIGFHLARHLALRGDAVVGYDNFNDYYPIDLKRKRAKLLRDCGVAVVEGDICNFASLQEEIARHQTTHLVHLAAQAGVRYSLTHPQAYVKANIEGFVNILEICRSNNAMKLIYASSSSVYGNSDKIPFAIDDIAEKQASVYGVTKKTNELLASTYHQLYGIPVTGLRFFTVYGPWGRPDMAYFSFTKAILKGHPIDLYNHGKVKRDFTYIDDIIQGTAAAIDLGAECERFNLGNHQPVEVQYLVQLLEEALGRKAKIRYLPLQLGDVEMTYADIKHSTQRLGYLPRTSLKEGIAHFINWYRENAGLPFL